MPPKKKQARSGPPAESEEEDDLIDDSSNDEHIYSTDSDASVNSLQVKKIDNDTLLVAIHDHVVLVSRRCKLNLMLER